MGYAGDGAATQATLSYPFGIALGPDGHPYIADTFNLRIRRVAPPLPGFSLGEPLIPSPEGVELYHFDAQGKHRRTLNALTGAELHRFAYDTAGRLSAITDATAISPASSGTARVTPPP